MLIKKLLVSGGSARSRGAEKTDRHVRNGRKPSERTSQFRNSESQESVSREVAGAVASSRFAEKHTAETARNATDASSSGTQQRGPKPRSPNIQGQDSRNYRPDGQSPQRQYVRARRKNHHAGSHRRVGSQSERTTRRELRAQTRTNKGRGSSRRKRKGAAVKTARDSPTLGSVGVGPRGIGPSSGEEQRTMRNCQKVHAEPNFRFGEAAGAEQGPSEDCTEGQGRNPAEDAIAN
jgi:hypothetical protein